MSEVSLRLNSGRMAKRVSMMHKTSSRTISCRANNELAMQRNKTNFYQVLSLESGNNIGLGEIKKAYRNMALQYHPDVCSPLEKEESTKRFVELREAYETLSDPVSRRKYDYELGLVNSLGFGFDGGFGILEERRNRFPKAVWETQLCELKRRRSHLRMKRNK